MEVNADDSTTIRGFKAIKNKLNSSYYMDGYHITLPMLASAMDPRFKHPSFVTASLRTQTYKGPRNNYRGEIRSNTGTDC